MLHRSYWELYLITCSQKLNPGSFPEYLGFYYSVYLKCTSSNILRIFWGIERQGLRAILKNIKVEASEKSPLVEKILIHFKVIQKQWR